MEDNKNTVILTVIAIATLLVSLVGATFAYFSSTGDTSKEVDVTVKTGSAGISSFIIDNDIDIFATASNFAKGGNSLSGTSTGTVTWTAPTLAEGVTDGGVSYDFCYIVTVKISENDFIYTVNEKTPELTLTVTKDGTSIISGMDITKYTGEINVPASTDEGASYINKLSATAGNVATSEWKATVTLVNLDTPQNENTNKALKGIISLKATSCE